MKAQDPDILFGISPAGNIEYAESLGCDLSTWLSKDGYIVQFRKCRGRKAVLNELVNLLCDNITDPENQIIGVAHADAYEDSLYVIEQIKKRIKVRDVINTTYDFCTGSHVGPESLAVFFMGKDRELGA